MNQDIGRILLIEDNPDDYEATARSLKKNHFINPIDWCNTGLDALDYLNKKGKYEGDGKGLPALILLDLNMPGLDGREFLRQIKQVPSFRSLPIIILTTSNDPKDIEECYSLGASTFIQKPVDFEGLTGAAKTIKDYWFGVALLPVTGEGHEH